MNAKYKHLVALYSDEIAKVKQLKARAKEAGEAVRTHMEANVVFDEVEHYINEHQLYAAWNDAESNYQDALVALTEQIRMEYAEVPFGKSAEKCVSAFLREAGL